MAHMHSKAELIQQLQLEHHDEGGYFRQIHQSEWTISTPERSGGTRFGINTIYYMLTDDSPIGHFHRNQSDIVHFFHVGSPMVYLTVTPEGQLSRTVLGPDPAQGHVFQMTVPGFDYRDRELATPELFQQRFPSLWQELSPYTLAHSTDSAAGLS